MGRVLRFLSDVPLGNEVIPIFLTGYDQMIPVVTQL